ncbi:hypothetical protein [Ulvibacter antarcticus]|uniref:DUF4467 domain-containing protein n=1 Tax=Ulvibacter antarcticus TaxID=442714 RepID=A0A3L9YGL5_9FLAO|nr:hypothetical protein [Ulvibacter antarcticus]RMA58590.1 hypothetical protein BXY75_1963 [Ulvibacter antarcticus]
MKKFLLVAAVLLIGGTMLGQEKPEKRTKTVVARYDGNSNDTYFFTNDVNNVEIRINEVDEELLSIYDLDSDDYLGMYFRMIYTIDYVENAEKTKDGKLTATKNPYNKELKIIDMEELKDYKQE